jgi:hypothetical protein
MGIRSTNIGVAAGWWKGPVHTIPIVGIRIAMDSAVLVCTSKTDLWIPRSQLDLADVELGYAFVSYRIRKLWESL